MLSTDEVSTNYSKHQLLYGKHEYDVSYQWILTAAV